MGNKYYHYYVEGEDDKKIVNTLKTDFQIIESGKVDVFNVVQNLINKNRLRVLRPNTTVVLVFDTDTGSAEILKQNIEFLEKQQSIKKVICIPQVNNLEDELVRSCAIKSIKQLTNSESLAEFKSDFLKINNLQDKLKEKEFDFTRFWSSTPSGVFKGIPNNSEEVRKKSANE